MAAEEPQSKTISKTRQKSKKKKLVDTDIQYLDIHAEKINHQKSDTQQIRKANNTENNAMREQLIEYIFSMTTHDPFLTNERWAYWFDQAQIIKSELQNIFKHETGQEQDGKFSIKHLGGSKYSYDFEVIITSHQDNKIKTFIPLEYKHQSNLGKLPQFYQVGNVSKPFFETPYYEYYYTHGLPEINELIGIDIKLSVEDLDIYAKSIGKSVYSKADWDRIRQGTYTMCSTINKQKPKDHNGKPKDKVYLLCDYNKKDLTWKLDMYPPGDFILLQDPTLVKVEKDKLLFPTETRKNLEIRLRWQNVTGLCNPSWQFNIGTNTTNTTNTRRREPKTPVRSKKTATKRRQNTKRKTARTVRTKATSNSSKTASTTRKRTRSPSKSPTRVKKKRIYSPSKSPKSPKSPDLMNIGNE